MTLRRITRIPYSGGKLRAEWWTEEFDAVVVACREFDSPWIPSIKGLESWADRFPRDIMHSREYRNPGDVAAKKVGVTLRNVWLSPTPTYEWLSKNVLIVGAFLSSVGIALDLVPHTSITVSVRVRIRSANLEGHIPTDQLCP